MTPEHQVLLDNLSRGLDEPPDSTLALFGLAVGVVTLILYELFVFLPAAVSFASP